MINYIIVEVPGGYRVELSNGMKVGNKPMPYETAQRYADLLNQRAEKNDHKRRGNSSLPAAR